MPRRVLLIAGLLPLLVSASAAAGGPRFPRKASPGEAGKLIHAARATLLPLYQLRGILFQTRLELSLMRAPPGERTRWLAWLKLPAGEAGYAAETLVRAQQVAPPERLALVAADPPWLSGGRDTSRTVQEMLSLAGADMLIPGVPLVVDDVLVANLAADPASLKRLGKRLGRVAAVSKALRRTPKKVAAVRRRFAKAKEATRRKGKRAMAGDLKSILGLAAEGVVTGISAPALVADAARAPAMSQAVVEDARALGAALGELQRRLVALAPELKRRVGFGLALKGLAAAVPEAAAYGPLIALLGPPSVAPGAPPPLPGALMTASPSSEPASPAPRQQQPAAGASRSASTTTPPAPHRSGPPTAPLAGIPAPPMAPPPSAAAPPAPAPQPTPQPTPPPAPASAAPSSRAAVAGHRPPPAPQPSARPSPDPAVVELRARLAEQRVRIDQMDHALRVALQRLARLESIAAGQRMPSPGPHPAPAGR